ncbi:hypothetical protein NW766_011116 [Fusarium irregulare]|uniref:Uncharacterized protein n=1 Tax=Fusarium irregulare TaxID=2494466 RepID=A0A9W8PFY4_9HYPO|nr:hypothetical protein NW766_011116 [Fusarium irregulare]
MGEPPTRRSNGKAFAKRTGRKVKELISPSTEFKAKEPSASANPSTHQSSQGPEALPLTVAQPTNKSVGCKPLTAHQEERPSGYTPQQVHPATCANASGNANENGILDRRVTDTSDMIESFKKTNEDLKQLLREQSSQIQQLMEDNETLRRQCSESAEKSYTNSNPRLPLSRPSSEIIKDWNTLAYDIENFVDNHFRDASQKRIASWATIQREFLRDIAEEPQNIVTSHKSGLALIKAALWADLGRLVFGGLASDGPMCWAGHYKRDIRRLDRKLTAGYSEKGIMGLSSSHHHWRTLMANMTSTLEDPQQRSQEVEHVAMNIEELLAPCRPRQPSSDAYYRDLRAVIRKTVDMDLVLSGQTDLYTLQWLSGGMFNDVYMAPAAGSSQGAVKNLRFMIRPGLHRADGQTEVCSNVKVVEKCTVWF